MAEFKIIKQTTPGAITFNYDELKAEIEKKAQVYETLVYTEENMTEAKNDKANLNKLKKALNDERIKREREFMEPFNDFKAKVNEIISIIDKPIGIIDKQVKAFEDGEREKKRLAIIESFDNTDKPTWLALEQIWNDKWLNKTLSLASIGKEIADRIAQIRSDEDTIANLGEFAFEAAEVYKESLNLGMAVTEGQRLADIQNRKEAAEKRKTEYQEHREEVATAAVTETDEGWVRFEAKLTTAQAKALKDWFVVNEIEFRPI